MQDQNRIVEDLAEARRRLEVLQSERDRAVNSLENLSARLNKPANPYVNLIFFILIVCFVLFCF